MRQPGRSRRAILEAGFWEIYRQGFRAARVEAILSGTGLTKGALYHHFPTKTALGSAVVDDVIRPRVRDWWLEPLASAPDPIDGLLRVVRGLERDDAPEMLVGGCPVFNLLQELAGVDEPFRRNLVAVLDEWRDAIAAALARGQAAGTVRADLHPRRDGGVPHLDVSRPGRHGEGAPEPDGRAPAAAQLRPAHRDAAGRGISGSGSLKSFRAFSYISMCRCGSVSFISLTNLRYDVMLQIGQSVPKSR